MKAKQERKPRRTDLKNIGCRDLDKLAGLAAADRASEARYIKLFKNTDGSHARNAIYVFTNICQRALILRDHLRLTDMRKTGEGSPEYEKLCAAQRLAALRLILGIGP